MKRAISLIILLLIASPAWARCPLCVTALDRDPFLGAAFKKAIFLLMIPALALFAGIFLLALRSQGSVLQTGWIKRKFIGLLSN
jgi:hypothetical protein